MPFGLRLRRLGYPDAGLAIGFLHDFVPFDDDGQLHRRLLRSSPDPHFAGALVKRRRQHRRRLASHRCRGCLLQDAPFGGIDHLGEFRKPF